MDDVLAWKSTTSGPYIDCSNAVDSKWIDDERNQGVSRTCRNTHVVVSRTEMFVPYLILRRRMSYF